MVFMVYLVSAVDRQFTQYGRERGRQNFTCVRLTCLEVVVAVVVIYSQLEFFSIYKDSQSVWSLPLICNSHSIAERGRGQAR